MKKIITLVLSLMIVLVVPSQAETLQSPSGWAEVEISLAALEGLLPNELRGSYQNSITRAEYVLIAKAVLDEADVEISSFNKYPFEDIIGHEYEDAIVVAYNAGVINGYEDSTFKPDNPITRQEMATLIVNLIRIIDPERDLVQKNTYEYSDMPLIGGWAKNNLDYCYNNSIIKGVGIDANGRKIIDPLGKATVEQSIILMYRVAESEQILEDEGFPTVEIGHSGQIVSFDEFVENSNKDTAEILYFMYESKKLEFINVSPEVVTMTDGVNMVMVVQNETENSVTLTLDNPVVTEIVEVYYDLVYSLAPDVEIERYVMEAVEGFGSDLTFKVDIDITSDKEFDAFSEAGMETDEEMTRQYIFKFELDK